MKALLIVALLALTVTVPAQLQLLNACEQPFDPMRQLIHSTVEAAAETFDAEAGTITWDGDALETIAADLVTASETYLNDCTEANVPLAEQADALETLTTISQITPVFFPLTLPDSTLEINTMFTASSELLDLNGDGTDEFVLYTQLPYFAPETVYMVQGGLTIGFFQTEAGWQGHVLAPTAYFSDDNEFASYAHMSDYPFLSDDILPVLKYMPQPEVEVIETPDAALTAVTTMYLTGPGMGTDLTILRWNDDLSADVLLRVQFDDWCYPGAELNWEIRDNGDVFIPSNGNEEGSPLHCGRTPEQLFTFSNGQYVAVA